MKIRAAWIKPLAYGALNIASASGIVFANKVVFSTYGYKYTCALTWIHTMFTLVSSSCIRLHLNTLPQQQNK